MDQSLYSAPLSLWDIRINDDFWGKETEVVRREVIPYQWEALNDRVEGASPSYSMSNFKTAVKINRRGKSAQDTFRGFVFQDSDLYKWIEAVAYSLAGYPDPALEGIADGAIDVVCAAAQEDGYLDTYYIINGRQGEFTDLRNNHELYCFGHLTEAAVAYFQTTGKDKLLHTAEKFADCIFSRFGPEEGKLRGYPGHEIAEMALVRLIAADTRVREDVGKAALMRGPVVYCMEEADNGSGLYMLSLSEKSCDGAVVFDDSIDGVSFKAVKMPGYRRESDEAKGLYHEWHPQGKEETWLKFIPYYMWANRGENEMQVWTLMQ